MTLPQGSLARLELRRLQETLADLHPDLYGFLAHGRDAMNAVCEEVLEELSSKWSHSIPEETMTLLRRKMREESLLPEVPHQLPSPLQEEYDYMILKDLDEKIKNAIDTLGISLSAHPVFGTLPIGRPNAMAISIQSHEECLIIFQSGIFMFAYLLAKPLFRSFPFSQSGDTWSFSLSLDECLATIQNEPTIRESFNDVIFQTLYNPRGPSAVKPYLLERAQTVMSDSLATQMELFVLGHEYGHVIAGHLESSRKILSAVQDVECEELIRTWQEEFEADRIGLRLSIEAAGRTDHDIMMSYLGADYFFSCVEVLENSISVAVTGTQGTIPPGTHPPAASRREALRGWFSRAVHPPDFALYTIEVAQLAESIINALWGDALPTILKAHQEGRSLSRSWHPIF